MMFRKASFDKRFPSVRKVLPHTTPTPVNGLQYVPDNLAAVFVPLCGYQEVQARRLRAVVKIYEAVHQRGGDTSFPLIISGKYIQMECCREMWNELRVEKPWLPIFEVDDSGYARTTHENGNALHGMLHKNIKPGSSVAVVTDIMHMNRILAHIAHDIHDYTFIPFRVTHTHAERRAARAMGVYEIQAAFNQLIDGRMKLAPFIHAGLSKNGQPLKPYRPRGKGVTSPAACQK